MASHYSECALETDLPASKRLVLLAIADSANAGNRIGHPGFERMKKWSGLKAKSRVLEIVAELVDEGYIVRHRSGVKGRQAEFIVFPHGCCALHGPLPGYSPQRGVRNIVGSGKGSGKGSGSYRTP